jgi:hypothetical protein
MSRQRASHTQPEVTRGRVVPNQAEAERRHRAPGVRAHERIPATEEQDGQTPRDHASGGARAEISERAIVGHGHVAEVSRAAPVVEGAWGRYAHPMFSPVLPLLVAVLAPALEPAPDAAGWRAHVEALAASDGAEPALRLAQGLGRRGERAAALRWAAEAEHRGADRLRVALVRGDIAFAAQDWLGALSGYLEVSSAAPGMAYAQVRLWHSLRRAPVEALAGTVDVARVRTFLERAGYHLPLRFPVTPDRAGALAGALRGHAALTRGETPTAITEFHAAIALDPVCPEAWRGLAAAETRAGHAAAARASSHLFLSLDPPETLDARRVRTILVDDARRRGLEKARP